MRLGINGWRLTQSNRTGVGRYLLNVVKHWTAEAVSGRFKEITFYSPKPADRHEIPLPENIRHRVLRPHWRMLLWENLCLGPFTTDDVLFCPSYSRPLLAHGKIVVTTHDATSQLYPELFPLSVRLFYNRLYGWSARQATLVITHAKAAQQDITRCYGVPPSRIRVVRPAPAEIFRPLQGTSYIPEVQERYLGHPVPYLLFVGKTSGRRNIPRLMESFAEFKRRTSLPHKLLLVGLSTQSPEMARILTNLGISGEVKHSGYVSDEDLNLIYNAAEAFIMPATYETLSFPVMEAQATGTPVVCVDTAGSREVTGGAALLISKFEVSEMAEAMSRLATDAALRCELAEKGLVNARRFSWQRCSAETLAVLEEAAQLPTLGRLAPRRDH